MKKAGFIILIVFLLLIISSISLVHSASLPTDALEDKVNEIDNTLDNIPKNSEDIQKQIQDKYLKEGWNELISKNKFIGPVHNLFMTNQWFFQILFREKYAFSLTFITTLVLWVCIFILSYKLFKPYFELYKALIFSMILSLVFAHAGIISWIVNSIFHIIYAKDTWWIRLILWIIFALVIFLIFYVDNIISKTLKSSKLAKEKGLMNQKIEESEAFIKGVKEGQNIVDKKNK